MKKFLFGFLLGLAFVELGKSHLFPTLQGPPGKFLGGEGGERPGDPQVGEVMPFVLKKVKG